MAKNFIGFDSATDFADSFFRIKDWSFTSIFAIGGALTSMITNYMWDNPSAVWTLWILLGIDWITGVWKSMKKKEFVSYKLWRMPIYFLMTSIIVSLSWWMAKGSIIFGLLPGIIMASFYSIYGISILENLAELEFLPKQFVQLIKNKFGLKVIFDKYTNKKDEK